MPGRSSACYPARSMKSIAEHISAEIRVHSEERTQFRLRASLGVYIGPFVVLGSILVASKEHPTKVSFNCGSYLEMIIIAACFMGLGVVAAHVEDDIWRKCNELRSILVRIHASKSVDPAEVASALHHEPRLTKAYMWIYGLMLVAVSSAVALIFSATSSG